MFWLIISWLVNDTRLAVRGLKNNPGFAAVAILALGLGIGANTAVFSVVDTVVLRPLPYRDAGRILVIWEKRVKDGSRTNAVSAADYLDWRAQNHVFSSLDADDQREFNLTGSGNAERVVGNLVTTDCLPVYGAAPLLGRAFTASDEAAGGHVALLSYGFWQRRFGGDPRVIGQSMRLDDVLYSVIGVMPPVFRMFIGTTPDFYAPLVLSPEEKKSRGNHRFLIVGRLRAGVSVEQARAEMETISSRLAKAYPADNTGHAANPITLSDQLTQQIRPAFAVLWIAVGFVLLIACANVANLLLARAGGRSREIAIRLAVGGTPRRLTAMLLTESLLLSALGGLTGVLIASVALRFVPLLASPELRVKIPGIETVAMDGRVLLYTGVVSLVTGILFGLAPAWQLLRSTASGLHAGSRSFSAGPSQRLLRQSLLVAEIAVAFTLLSGSALLITSFARLIHVDPGFQASNRLSMYLSLPRARYAEPGRQASFYRELLEQESKLPGVISTAITTLVPGNTWGPRFGFRIEGQPRPRTLEEFPKATWRVVSDNYFSTMGIPILRGRSFEPGDRADATKVVLISRTMSRRYFGSADPVGRRIALGSQTEWRTIIGITGDTRYLGLDKDPKPEFYFPVSQLMVPGLEAALILRTSTVPEAVAESARREVAKLDAGLPVSRIRTIQQVVDESVSGRRFASLLMSFFAAVAFVLAAGGLYSVMSYLVSQRIREMGIRMALGAQASDLLRLVLRQGALVAIAGVLLGSLIALTSARFLSGFLVGVSPSDPRIYISITIVMIGTALAATLIPARRAARVDPVRALRHD